MCSKYAQCSCDFEVNQKNIKGSCQSGKKVVPNDPKSEWPLVTFTAPNFIDLFSLTGHCLDIPGENINQMYIVHIAFGSLSNKIVPA